MVEPEDVARIRAMLEDAHWGLLSIRPVEEAKIGFDRFRELVRKRDSHNV